MTAATEPPPRIATLDILRGVAVMGILAMNIQAFAMPEATYLNPAAYGSRGPVDYAAWAFNFVLIDGKMRGLFSFLFGASMLLVIEKAQAKGESAAAIHYRRMLWLLLFGYLHFYFIWYGDILTGYASIGMIAWFFRRKTVKALVWWGILFVFLELLVLGALGAAFYYVGQAASQPGASPEIVAQWADMTGDLAPPSADRLARTMALYTGSWWGIAHHQLTEATFQPLAMAAIFGWETLGYMLLGMASLKSGFFTGAWTDALYRRVAIAGFAIAVPAYCLFAWIIWSSGYEVQTLFAFAESAPVVFRPVMVVAIAALIIQLARRGGPLVARVAATGRAAFTNYLGTSILMTGLFYGWGLGLFGSMRRAELWLVVIAMWAVMLLWSKPWLDRYQYGPFEWLWRSLARWKPQPMRRTERAAAG